LPPFFRRFVPTARVPVLAAAGSLRIELVNLREKRSRC